MADAVIEGKGLYDQALIKDKRDDGSAAVPAANEMDQRIEQSAAGGV
jgi:septum formation inhibitor-activating ATPase MinD